MAQSFTYQAPMSFKRTKPLAQTHLHHQGTTKFTTFHLRTHTLRTPLPPPLSRPYSVQPSTKAVMGQLSHLSQEVLVRLSHSSHLRPLFPVAYNLVFPHIRFARAAWML